MKGTAKARLRRYEIGTEGRKGYFDEGDMQ
jgi:hypothetical protein